MHGPGLEAVEDPLQPGPISVFSSPGPGPVPVFFPVLRTGLSITSEGGER